MLQRLTVSFLLLFALMFLPLAGISAKVPHDEGRFFDVVALDTMKFSRDGARNKQVLSEIPILVSQAASIHPTHIAIGTPYDDEFIPVARAWVGEIRRHGKSVWFRGNFSKWEDWFDYGRFDDPNEHIKLTYNYIVNNPELFADGDIFTPVPEAENGGFGDPRFSADIKQKFFAFLPQSYASCNEAFAKIRKNVTCGYYSVNGDVAELFTREDVQKLGNLLVIDHYVKTPKELIDDARALHEATGADIILGEYGAPIPDIHGDLSQEEQADLIDENLLAIVQARDFIKGINYWTALGGSTQLFDGLTAPRKAAATVAKYYQPVKVEGTVLDHLGIPVKGARVRIDPFDQTTTNSLGTFTLLTTPDFMQVEVEKDGYESVSEQVTIAPDSKARVQVQLEPVQKGIWYSIRLFMGKIIDLFRRN
jgi:hypothetical protein